MIVHGCLTEEECIVACRNIGFDLTCGACACLFYTGSNGYEHERSCKTVPAYRLERLTIHGGPVTDNEKCDLCHCYVCGCSR